MSTLKPLPSHFNQYFVTQGELGTFNYYRQLKHTITCLSEAMAQNQKPAPTVTPAQLSHNINQLEPISQHGLSFDKVLEQTLNQVVKQSIAVNHPHCCAHLHCPPLIPALAAEVILTTLNQSMDSWDQAPAATLLEQQLIDWLCSRTGYHSSGDGGFTSGGTQSNLMALLLARDHTIAQHKPNHNVQRHGLPADAQRYRIICSADAHFTITKSCAVLGLGSQSVVTVATNSAGQMCPHTLAETLVTMNANHQIPIAIVATAGTTDLGAIDALADIAKLAKQHRVWLHVDAAYGGALLLEEQAISDIQHPLHGLSLADSITIDFHKLFFQPISCGALLVKDKQHLKPLCFHADYLSRAGDEELNLVDKSLSTTRRFDALKLWMSLKTLGLNTFSAMIAQLKKLALYAAEHIDAAPQLQLLMQPNLTTVLFRVQTNNTEDDINNDRFQQQLRRTLLYTGQAVVAETRLKGRIYLKLTLLNPCTTEDDIKQLIDLIITTADTIHSNASAA